MFWTVLIWSQEFDFVQLYTVQRWITWSETSFRLAGHRHPLERLLLLFNWIPFYQRKPQGTLKVAVMRNFSFFSFDITTIFILRNHINCDKLPLYFDFSASISIMYEVWTCPSTTYSYWRHICLRCFPRSQKCFFCRTLFLDVRCTKTPWKIPTFVVFFCAG